MGFLVGLILFVLAIGVLGARLMPWPRPKGR